MWSKGDFAMVANIVYNDAETLAEALGIIPGERVLDRRRPRPGHRTGVPPGSRDEAVRN